MNHFVQILKDSTLFSDLSVETIENEIMPHVRLQDVPKGNYLIHYQERYDFFGVIVKGKINVLHIYESGKFGIMGILADSDLVGVDLVCTRNRISPYYAVAAQQTQVLCFSAGLVLEPGMLREEIRMSLLQKMLTIIADENMRKEYRLAILFQKGLRDRIMTFLTMQANKRHTKTFSVPFTRDEMASFLCVNRTSLSHELSLMEKEGIIRFSRNTFTLLDWNPKSGDY